MELDTQGIYSSSRLMSIWLLYKTALNPQTLETALQKSN